MNVKVANIEEDLGTKIIGGVRKAVRKVIETAAANNESLIIGDKDGTHKAVPAKELLKQLSK